MSEDKPKRRRRKTVRAPEEDWDAEMSSEERSYVQRFVSWSKLVLGLVVVLGASGTLVWGIYSFAVTTPRFGLEKAEVQGAQRYSESHILQLAGIERGTNLFQIDLAKAQTELLSDPWIREARLSRELPRTLHIEVVEYQAEALISIGDQLMLVTPEGTPFKVVEDGDPFDLPVISGVTAKRFAIDRERALDRVRTGLEVLRQYSRLDMAHVQPPQEVHLHEDGAVTLTVGSSGLTLELGKGVFRQKLLMAARVAGRLSRRGRLPGILFLDNEAHPERVVARMRVR